jgi:glycosyltransferase involved in cell wall biosynthesis
VNNYASSAAGHPQTTRLLLYSHFFAPSVGGVETLVLSLARGLAASQFQITLVTQTAAATFDDRTLPFTVVRCPSVLQLWRLLRASDVLHLAGPALTPLLLARLARKPVVLEHHGFQTICPNGQLLIEPQGTPCPGHFMAGNHRQCLRCNSSDGWLASARLWLLTFVRRFLSARVAANITPTEWLGRLLQLPATQAIPHGLAPPPPQGGAPESADPPIIVFLGRLVSTKGVNTLLAAASLLRQQQKSFTILIIGEGPERPALQAFVNAQQLTPFVRFAGRLGPDELHSALATASIAVVPSLGGEVFGLVVAENMLRGLPVVASDLGAFVEVLGTAGLTFETGNPAALAVQLGRLFDDPNLRAELGLQARQRAAEFCDMQRMIAAHQRVYQVVRSSRG